MSSFLYLVNINLLLWYSHKKLCNTTQTNTVEDKKNNDIKFNFLKTRLGPNTIFFLIFRNLNYLLKIYTK